MAQQFKNETLTRTKVRNNILAIWNETSENDRFDWYGQAHDFAIGLCITNELPRDTENIAKACGIIAALSPMCSWDVNKRLASQMMSDSILFNVWDVANNMPCLKSNAKKAAAILLSNGSDQEILDILKGPKTSAFFLNIMYPDKAISLTMDRHAISIAVGFKLPKDQMQMTAKQYDFFQECYRWTAAKLGINPLILQSATWVVWRKMK